MYIFLDKKMYIYDVLSKHDADIIMKEIKEFISIKRYRYEVLNKLKTLLEDMNIHIDFDISKLELLNISSHSDDIKEHVLKNIMNEEYKNKVILSGAGLSFATGIKDYKDGLFKYITENDVSNHPQSIISLNFIKRHPILYYHLNKKFPIYNDASPTNGHKFIKYFHENNTLHKYFTQNIDNIDSKLNLGNKLIQAHGSIGTLICFDCNQIYNRVLDMSKFNDLSLEEVYKYETLEKYNDTFSDLAHFQCRYCNSFLYNNYVYYDCDLPDKFYEEYNSLDYFNEDIDMMIILGTRLIVYPFASIYERVKQRNPKCIIVNFDIEKCISSDVFIQGDIDFTTLYLMNVK